MNPTVWKSGYVAAVIAAIAVLVLHAPWRGYVTTRLPEAVDTLTLLARCPDIGRLPENDNNLDHASMEKKFAAHLACANTLKPSPLPIRFTQWRSSNPYLPKLARLRNVGILLVLASAATAIWAALHWRSVKSARQRRRGLPGQQQ